MKIMIGYPPLESPWGQPTLGQNRQFRWFGNLLRLPDGHGDGGDDAVAPRHDVVRADGVAEEWSYAEYRARSRASSPRSWRSRRRPRS
jgi:hypothetical protein